MAQYIMLAGKSVQGREQHFICQTGKTISAARTKATGLVDSSGREIFKVKNPIGFIW